MYSNIKNLSENTINQIAAGEVVENYASMIKELIENSIDAGAQNISVHFLGRNLEIVKIIDDGFGMSKQDLSVCYKRYYTSKLSSIEDLQNIQTMGFRGEALSSIASVSQLNVISRKKNEENGYDLQINYGNPEPILATQRNHGTTIIIQNLFKNAPVRKKFLSSATTELKKAIRVIQQISFCYTQINFKIFQDQKQIFNISSTILKNRLKDIFSKGFSENLIQVQVQNEKYKLSGFVGSIEDYKTNQSNQFFFVNQRIINSSILTKAFKEIYQYTNQMKFPIGVLFLTCPTSLVDINIHPSKKEIRFLDQQNLIEFFQMAIQKSLAEKLKLPSFEGNFTSQKSALKSNLKFDITTVSQKNEKASQLKLLDQTLTEKQSKLVTPTTTQNTNSENLDTSNPKAIQFESNNSNEKNTFDYLYLNNQFILLEIEGALAMVHQKRAHQRILYEQALDNLKEQQISTQQLLFPEMLDLNNSELEVLNSNLPYLKKLGFDLCEFGPLSYQIQGIPLQLHTEVAKTVLKNIINDLEIQKKQTKNTLTILAKVYAKHASIANSKKLNHQEIIHLIDYLFSTENPFVSPEGSQIILRYDFLEIQKKFKS